ncbi:MAG TPA: hypothetical protein VN980_14520 [Alphaproteobacteria bacterium]|nr:hypothetical protein [Alphaproteobacteria bacterium]
MPAKSVLLAAELGTNFGHVGPLLRLAREFRRHGHHAVLALRDVVGPRPLLADENFPILQAPIWPGSAHLGGRAGRISSYADILALHGFAGAEGLAAMVEAWDRLLGFAAPDLVIADHSPTLCLAAYGVIPTVVFGTGFAVPPVHDARFPPFAREQPPLVAEWRLLEAVQSVQAHRKRPLPPSLPGLFDAPLRVVAAFPELDPYRVVRREPVLGPLEPLPSLAPLPESQRIFAYLGDENPSLPTIVECLVELKTPSEVYLRGEAGVFRRLLSARGVMVHDRPPPLDTLLPHVSAVLSQAGSAITHAALSAGRPQLCFPLHLEAELTASALASLNVGRWVWSRAPKSLIAAELERVLRDDKLARNATRIGEFLAVRTDRDRLGVVTEACLKMMG